MKITVIISAHRKGRELECVLTGYAMQTRKPDQIIVAQDGRDPMIGAALEAVRRRGWTIPLLYQNQEQRGFGKYRALNRAVLAASGDLLLFTDGDCIPRDDYVANYVRLMRRGIFLSGGSHVSIPEAYHLRHDLLEAVRDQSLFDYGYLSAIPGFCKSANRLTRRRWLARALDVLTQRNAFSGSNSCAWRDDVLAVGGFDEQMAYGGGDLNMGLRLNHIGVRGVRARHTLVSLHLDHGRSYYCADKERANHDWNRQVRHGRLVLPRESQICDEAVFNLAARA
ncbi:glycosyltransferase [Janthinobacterium sp. HH01]|uniref:glycosyltransferase n=1 Tax=Janthinobacterium sp. HH01 TaxID=1198452 RepID=UPI0002AEB822|nr:glycosyltransferase [Janthinobacterium sp. HH01]ELX12538.1 glycosyltransferase [Janthinobacterium sp. HH01]